MQAAKTEIPVKLGEIVMRLASLIASAAGILVLLSASGVSAQSAAEEPRSWWYVGGGIGAPWPSNLAQSGWNRDPICYPTDACSVLQTSRERAAQAMLAYNPKNMTEDEREHLLTTVGQAHAGLSEVALKLRLGLPPKTPALKTAIKAERVAFDLKRSLQRLEVKDVETITRRAPVLPEVRRGGKVVDPESLLRHENRHDKRLTGLPRRNTPRRSG